jgi:hypothetical protein
VIVRHLAKRARAVEEVMAGRLAVAGVVGGLALVGGGRRDPEGGVVFAVAPARSPS